MEQIDLGLNEGCVISSYVYVDILIFQVSILSVLIQVDLIFAFFYNSACL